MKTKAKKNQKQIFLGISDVILLRTSGGDEFTLYMRDDTIEMSVPGSDIFYSVDMETGKIEEV